MAKWNKITFLSSAKEKCEPRVQTVVMDLIRFAEEFGMKIGKIWNFRFGEKKSGIIHTQRIKDLFFHQRLQILAFSRINTIPRTSIPSP